MLYSLTSETLKYIKVHTATRWTIRHSLKLHWFADLMNVTKEVTIHRPIWDIVPPNICWNVNIVVFTYKLEHVLNEKGKIFAQPQTSLWKQFWEKKFGKTKDCLLDYSFVLQQHWVCRNLTLKKNWDHPINVMYSKIHFLPSHC